MRVLLATGLEVLDQQLNLEIQQKQIEVAGICLYREAVVQDARGKGADTVIISANLPGTCDLITDVILPLRAQDARIILLPGKRGEENARDLIARAVVFGVYDVIYDPITASKVLERLHNPARFADVRKDLGDVNLESQFKVLEQLKKLQDEKAVEEGVKEIGRRGKEKPAANLKFPRLNLPEIKLPQLKLPPAPQLPSFYRTSKNKKRFRDIVCALWNSSGFFLSTAALNLAVTAAGEGFDVALMNFNLVNPETDIWFGIKQGKEINPYDAGIMTFGERLKPELALKMLQKRAWGVKYLPCGNKLASLGTPDFGPNGVQLAREIIACIAAREATKPKLTLIEAGNSFEYPFSYAALTACRNLLIPVSGSLQELMIVRQQLEELRKLEVVPWAICFMFICQGNPPKTPGNRVSIPPDWGGYQRASLAGKPYCLLDHAKTEIWREVLVSAFRV